jgi:repressor of nif and glnA expression
MHETDDANDTLRLAILSVLATRETPMTAREIADELARLALEGQRIAFGEVRERGH